MVVHTRDGDVLLLERCKPAGYWQSVTGGLKRGESAAEAAVREVREETGLDAVQSGEMAEGQRCAGRDGHVSSSFGSARAGRFATGYTTRWRAATVTRASRDHRGARPRGALMGVRLYRRGR